MKPFALACLLFSSLMACATEPSETTAPEAPELAALDEPALAPTAPGTPVANAEYGDCLMYCNGRPPFSVCVPVCRIEREIYFPPEPIELVPLPTCGDNICQLPEEGLPGHERYCRRDCRWEISIARTKILIDGFPFVEASTRGVQMPASAFDIKW
jgi:hypothetical protein